MTLTMRALKQEVADLVSELQLRVCHLLIINLRHPFMLNVEVHCLATSNCDKEEDFTKVITYTRLTNPHLAA